MPGSEDRTHPLHPLFTDKRKEGSSKEAGQGIAPSFPAASKAIIEGTKGGVPKRFRAALLLTTLLYFPCPSLAPAQNTPHPAFRHYTTDHGLASSETYCILQDRQGFIWISSDNGVSRFDGYEFRNYGMKDGLRENVIFLMQLDSLGRLWMQAMSGNLYYLDGETIRPYWHNEVLLNYKDRLTSKGFIVEGAGETVHVATRKYGVITISKDGRARTFSQEDQAYWQVFEKNDILIHAYAEPGGPLVRSAFQEDLYRQNRHIPVYFHTEEGDLLLSDLSFTKKEGQSFEAFRLAGSRYLLKIFNDVFLIDQGRVRWRCYFPYHIVFARLMTDGRLFVGLHFNQGLRVYPSVEAFRKNEGHTWLPGQTVSHIMESPDGSIWLGTNENGIFYAPVNAIQVYSLATGLAHEKVTALAPGHKRMLYAGFASGEVWSLNHAEGTWAKLPDIPALDKVKTLYFDRQNQELWVGRDKLFHLQKKQWIKKDTPDHDGQLISISNRITESPDGRRIWVCNHYGFMSIELPQKQPANIHMGYGQRTLVVRQDFSGSAWVGRPDGLFEWKDGDLLDFRSLHPAFSLRVEDIALLPDSTLVVATKGGGVVFWKGNRFEQITTKQGLTADMMENVYADDKGVTWAGTLNGLNRISGSWGNRQVEPITVFHGLPSNEINGIVHLGDTIWVATSKGLSCFSEKPKDLFSPKPLIASVLVNNQPVEMAGLDRLSPAENNLAISFFTINFKMNGKIPYRYRMGGGDWVATMTRSLNFPALTPGRRLFEVQAQNENGAWSESAFLQFTIASPWWASWWARGGAIIALFSLGFGGYKYRTGQLKRKNQIQHQIAELERAALQAQMNPHFIFNCLNSIQNYILQNEKEAAIMYLGRFAGLVRSILNASVSGKIILAEEVKLLNNYLELEKLRFKGRFTYEIRIDETLDVFEVQIPPLLVQPYVENAVQHGISGKDNGGKVSVFFEKKANCLEVSIQDNGTGLIGERDQGENAKAHKPFGMSITRNRLELLSGNKENEAVHIQTLYDEGGRVCGTLATIQINLPSTG